MVLRRVGKRFVDVLVNGTQVDSFEQTGERAGYDVGVSDDPTTITSEFSGDVTLPANTDWEIAKYDGWTQRPPDEIRITTETYGQDYIEIEIYDSEGILFSVSSESPFTGWETARGELDRVKIGNTSANEALIDFTIGYRYTGVQSGFTVDGATQS